MRFSPRVFATVGVLLAVQTVGIIVLTARNQSAQLDLYRLQVKFGLYLTLDDPSIMNPRQYEVNRLMHENSLADFEARAEVLQASPDAALSASQARQVADQVRRRVPDCQRIDAMDIDLSDAFHHLEDIVSPTQRRFLNDNGTLVGRVRVSLFGTTRRERSASATFLQYWRDMHASAGPKS